MNLSDNPTLKEIYKYAVAKKKDLLREKDYLPIIVASTISAATSWYISKYDFAKNKITGDLFLDILLAAAGVSLLFFITVIISLNLLRLFERVLLFLTLIWKKYKPFKSGDKKD